MSPGRCSRDRVTDTTTPRSLRDPGVTLNKRRARPFRARIAERLARGEHLVLYGPVGSGKSTLLRALHARLQREGTPSGIADTTTCLGDMTRTFARAYPEIDIAGLTQHRIRVRLAAAAEQRRGVLLFDHVEHLNAATVGFLHRLRGGLARVAPVLDVDGQREREALRARCPALPLVAMPRSSARQLRAYLRGAGPETMPDLMAGQERQILRAAHGRPGWMALCSRLLREDRYWHGDTLYVAVLCADTEIALRLGCQPFLQSEIQKPQLTPPVDRRKQGPTPV